MREVPNRAILSVVRREGVWSVELEDERFGHSPDQQVARAAAHRRAREMQDRGVACRVNVQGDSLWAVL